jgi:hypothetical protein
MKKVRWLTKTEQLCRMRSQAERRLGKQETAAEPYTYHVSARSHYLQSNVR